MDKKFQKAVATVCLGAAVLTLVIKEKISLLRI